MAWLPWGAASALPWGSSALRIYSVTDTEGELLFKHFLNIWLDWGLKLGQKKGLWAPAELLGTTLLWYHFTQFLKNIVHVSDWRKKPVTSKGCRRVVSSLAYSQADTSRSDHSNSSSLFFCSETKWKSGSSGTRWDVKPLKKLYGSSRLWRGRQTSGANPANTTDLEGLTP